MLIRINLLHEVCTVSIKYAHINLHIRPATIDKIQLSSNRFHAQPMLSCACSLLLLSQVLCYFKLLYNSGFSIMAIVLYLLQDERASALKKADNLQEQRDTLYRDFETLRHTLQNKVHLVLA